MFLYIDPLKQGLKLHIGDCRETALGMFLYIDPLKQGLKPIQKLVETALQKVFIHRSIKTRIETRIVNVNG